VTILSLLLNPFGAVRVHQTAFACECTSRGRSVSIASQVKDTPPGHVHTAIAYILVGDISNVVRISALFAYFQNTFDIIDI